MNLGLPGIRESKFMEPITKLLKDFAHDLINHCVDIENGEVTLSEKVLDSLIDLYKSQSNAVVWIITKEHIQTEAKQKLGRKLSEVEINEFVVRFDGPETYFDLSNVISGVIDKISKI